MRRASNMIEIVGWRAVVTYHRRKTTVFKSFLYAVHSNLTLTFTMHKKLLIKCVLFVMDSLQ